MAIYSGFSHKKMVIFHCYVSPPEGNLFEGTVQSRREIICFESGKGIAALKIKKMCMMEATY